MENKNTQENDLEKNKKMDEQEIEQDSSSSAEEAEKVEQDIKKMLVEEETFKVQLQRLQAEFMNYKKRVEREKSELSTFVKGEFTKRFLPIIDDMNRIRTNINSDEKALKDALNMVFNKLEKFISDEKIAPIAKVGDHFNAEFHEAIMQVPTEKTEDDEKIVSVFEQGYKLNDRVLRFAKVQVYKSN
jgi:molecular chaperone GrpE